jgi:hypothetical protein
MSATTKPPTGEPGTTEEARLTTWAQASRSAARRSSSDAAHENDAVSMASETRRPTSPMAV